jgi:hypothetical protein
MTAPLRGVIEPGTRAQIPTRLGPVGDTSALRNIKAGIVGARIVE